ncbi:MAG: hypothetical protein OXU98_09005 [Gammaproteobacteria bacterium]|nr:hypothetical protein [Gammaproteobacteria bacterium]
MVTTVAVRHRHARRATATVATAIATVTVRPRNPCAAELDSLGLLDAPWCGSVALVPQPTPSPNPTNPTVSAAAA